MRSYGQFCPVAKAAEIFCERWTALIIRDLAAGSSRFSEIHRGIPLMSPTLLSRRLKQLEAEGVVERRKSTAGLSWTYHLTEAGADFVPMVETLANWGRRWTRRELAENEIDLGLLLWSLERGVDPTAFGPGRTAVALCFTDQPAAKAQWWLVNADGRCDLCVDDPGFDVDLCLRASLSDMIQLLRGDLTLHRALAEDRLEAIGRARVRRRLKAWLNLQPFTRIPSMRTESEPASTH